MREVRCIVVFTKTRAKTACNLTVEERLAICIGVAKSLSYLHSSDDHNIVHSNMKSDNILLDRNLVAKISDFGLSRTCAATPRSSETITPGAKGTDGYIASECYAPDYKPRKEADVYAFGIVLLEVLCERRAWEALAVSALQSFIKGGHLGITVEYVKTNMSPECSQRCENVVRDCLKSVLGERPSMSHVVHELESAFRLQKKNRHGNFQTTWTDHGLFSSENDLAILYHTSSKVYLPTYNNCERTQQILDQYEKRVDERDLNVDPAYLDEM